MVISRLPSDQLSSDLFNWVRGRIFFKKCNKNKTQKRSASWTVYNTLDSLSRCQLYLTPWNIITILFSNQCFFFRKEVCSEARSCSWIGACGLASTGSPGRNSRASNRGLPSVKKLFGIFASKTLFYFTTLK